MEIIPNWHPLLVHFTIALYATSALLFTLGYFGAENRWKAKITGAAYINLWLGAVITVLTVAAGIYAYNTVAHDAPSHLAMTDHRNWALATAAFFWGLAVWSAFRYRAGKAVGLFFVVALLIGAGLLGVTGFKGGDVVYRYGLGVMSLPKAEGEGHNHSHSHENGADHDHAAQAAPKTDDGHDHDH